MGILKKNFKEIYIFTLLYVALIIGFSLKVSNIVLGLIIAVLYSVVETGWHWYILNVYREDKNAVTVFKEVIKSLGWIVILSCVKNMVITAIVSLVGYMALQFKFFISFLEISAGNLITINSDVVNVVSAIISVTFSMFIISFFVFVELIYYDNRERGPLSAVFDSMEVVKNNYFKVLRAFSIKLVCYIIVTIVLSVFNLKYYLGLEFILFTIFYPIYGIKICGVYDKINIKKGEIDDSLTYVARALDESAKK